MAREHVYRQTDHLFKKTKFIGDVQLTLSANVRSMKSSDNVKFV